MTRDDIISMAREAHRQLVTLDYPGHLGQLDPWTMQLLARFADLVADAERESNIRAIRAVQAAYNKKLDGGPSIEGGVCSDCIGAIRARSKA